MSLFAELKRRNVFRAGAAYLAFSWLLIQIVETLLPLFGISDDAARTVVVVLAIGFIPVMVVAWTFELTADGFRREAVVDHDSASSRQSTRRLDRVVIVLLGLAVVYFAVDKFIFDPARDTEIAEQAAEQARGEALVQSYGEHSIAVLPFEDLSPGNDQEYFSDGIAEEIINLLSRIHNLRVIARSSAFSFKGQNLAASVIAAELNVRYIMEGSVRWAGDKLRVTTTMIDARTDTQLWSENYDREFDDIFAIQDEIASEVVDRLELQISGQLPLAERVDPESYALYLEARHLSHRHNKEDIAAADRLLDEALALDPNNVAALLLASNVNAQKEYWGLQSRDEAIAKTRAAMKRVLELDPDNARARIELGSIEQDALDTWEGELQAASFALRLLPTDVEANAQAAGKLGHLGFSERALEYSRYVTGKDPMCVGCLRQRMFLLMVARNFDEAIEINRRYRSLTGGSGTYTLGIIQLLQGDAEVALKTFEVSDTFEFVELQGKALAYWTLGRTAEYEAALADLEATLLDEEFDKFRVRPEDYLAGTYAWVGRTDEAFAILDQLIDPPRSWGPIRWNVDPMFENLHDDPRWQALLEKEGISAQQIAGYQPEKLFPGPGIKPPAAW
ncbi:MAG: hypothetical protein IID59_11090 [Proteobacteria bacterium]|nr:hypothetical protein [Pseudomonadota bacterium]